MTELKSVILCVLLGLPASHPDRPDRPKEIPVAEAKNHIGETATVCGKVVGTSIAKYQAGNFGYPISLDLEKPEPDPVFVIGTLSPKRLNTAEVESTYQGKMICATGKITELRGVPEIITRKPDQIVFKSDSGHKTNH